LAFFYACLIDAILVMNGCRDTSAVGAGLLAPTRGLEREQTGYRLGGGFLSGNISLRVVKKIIRIQPLIDL
jgi:hypothetical protein